MTEINVQDKFKEKLGRDFREYVIQGACDPALAWEAFAKEINIGTLLPCNVVVYRDDEDKTIVMVMDPVATLGIIGNAELSEIAAQVQAKMERVLVALRILSDLPFTVLTKLVNSLTVFQSELHRRKTK